MRKKVAQLENQIKQFENASKKEVTSNKVSSTIDNMSVSTLNAPKVSTTSTIEKKRKAEHISTVGDKLTKSKAVEKTTEKVGRNVLRLKHKKQSNRIAKHFKIKHLLDRHVTVQSDSHPGIDIIMDIRYINLKNDMDLESSHVDDLQFELFARQEYDYRKMYVESKSIIDTIMEKTVKESQFLFKYPTI